MLKVKMLDPRAKLPTVSNPGTDLGFDLYAIEDAVLWKGLQKPVRTGISAVFERDIPVKFGLLVWDRSGMALKRGIVVSAGAVDSGYRGEILVVLTYMGAGFDPKQGSYNYNPCTHINAGDRIAQAIPQSVQTGYGVITVDELPPSSRGAHGFGSSGK